MKTFAPRKQDLRLEVGGWHRGLPFLAGSLVLFDFVFLHFQEQLGALGSSISTAHSSSRQAPSPSLKPAHPLQKTGSICGCLTTAIRSPEQWIPRCSCKPCGPRWILGWVPHLWEFQCSVVLSAAHGDPRNEVLSQFFMTLLLPSPLASSLPSFLPYIREKKEIVEGERKTHVEAQLSAIF